MLFLLFACNWKPFGVDGGQSGNEGDGQNPYCAETSREPIDLYELPVGFKIPPGQLIDAVVGNWSGSFDDGATTDVALTAVWNEHAPELVTEVRVSFTESEDGLGSHTVQAPSEHCPARYEVTANVVFTGYAGGFDDEALSMTFSAAADGRDFREAIFWSSLPMTDVAGTVELPWDASEWDTNELQVFGDMSENNEGYMLAGNVRWVSTLFETNASKGNDSIISLREEDVGWFYLESM